MKKFLTILLILAVAGGAFAQWKPTVSIEVRPDLLYMTTPTGEGAQAKSDYHVDKTGYKGTGVLDFLTHSNYYGGNDAKLNLNYTGEDGLYSAYVRLNLDPLFVFSTISSGTIGTVATQTTGGFFTPDRRFTVDRIFSLYIDDYSFKGKMGDYFEAYMGNGGDRGKTNSFRFANFNDYLRNGVGSFGILAPTLTAGTATIGFNDMDNNNLQRQINPTSAQPNKNTRPWFGLFGKYAPFTLGLAVDVSYADFSGASASYSKGAGTIRFSGEKIADLITFDVLYRFAAFDPTKDTAKDSSDPYNTTTPPATTPTYGTTVNGQPDGKGWGEHNFGIYAGLNPISGLGVSVGYTGYFRTKEDNQEDVNSDPTNPDWKTFSYSNPFYNGIDLRAAYTGIDKLTITLHNNVSFASAKGYDHDTDKNTKITSPLAELNYGSVTVGGSSYSIKVDADEDSWEKDASQSWFALYNALGFKYKLSDKLTADFQIGNRYGKLSGEFKSDFSGAIPETTFKYASSSIVFSAGLSAGYAFNSHVSISTGLTTKYTSNTYEAPALNVTKRNEAIAANKPEAIFESATYKTGTFELAIPILFKIAY